MQDLARPNLGNLAWREKMLKLFKEEKIEVAIYDNISALTSGIEENKAELWDPIADFLKTARHRGTSSILYHHPNKSGDQRGTSKREDIISNSIVLKHPPGYTRDDGARFLVDFTKCRVSNRYLDLIADLECKIIEISDGRYRYEWTEPAKESSVTVLRFIKEGIAQKNIATMLGLTPGRVSQIKGDLFKKKMIKTNGNGNIELTDGGEAFLFNHYPNSGEFRAPIG
jgi:putative DNA primase/helicase